MNRDGRRARARLAAHRRWHSDDDDFEQVTGQYMHEIKLANIDARIDELFALAPKMTGEQIMRLRHLAAVYGLDHPDAHVT